MKQDNLKARLFITDAVSKRGPIRFIGRQTQRKRGTIHASWTCAVRRDGNLFDQYVSEVLAMKSWIIYNMPTEYLLY